MSDPATRVPASVAGDSTDVSTALEIAGALWQKGSRDESLRWLKRAIEAAGEGGDPARADQLTSAVAELERSVGPEPAVDMAAPTLPASTVAPSPAASAPPTTGRPPPSRLSAPPPPLPARAQRSTAPPQRAAVAVDPAIVAMMPASFSVPAGTPIRVSVKASARDPDLLVVRPLPDGRALPPGTREGTLVLAADDAEARGHKNGSPVS